MPLAILRLSRLWRTSLHSLYFFLSRCIYVTTGWAPIKLCSLKKTPPPHCRAQIDGIVYGFPHLLQILTQSFNKHSEIKYSIAHPLRVALTDKRWSGSPSAQVKQDWKTDWLKCFWGGGLTLSGVYTRLHFPLFLALWADSIKQEPLVQPS